jgi:hypothetical protein
VYSLHTLPLGGGVKKLDNQHQPFVLYFMLALLPDFFEPTAKKGTQPDRLNPFLLDGAEVGAIFIELISII